MTARWFVTEQVILVDKKPRGVLRYYSDGWYAAVGEYFSSDLDDHLTENKEFDTKQEAVEWIEARLIARGYM